MYCFLRENFVCVLKSEEGNGWVLDVTFSNILLLQKDLGLERMLCNRQILILNKNVLSPLGTSSWSCWTVWPFKLCLLTEDKLKSNSKAKSDVFLFPVLPCIEYLYTWFLVTLHACSYFHCYFEWGISDNWKIWKCFTLCLT